MGSCQIEKGVSNALEHCRSIGSSCGGCYNILESLCIRPAPTTRGGCLDEVARFGLGRLEGVHYHAAVGDNVGGYFRRLGLK